MHLARRRSRRVVHPSTSPSILIQSRSCLLCLVRTLRLNSLAHWHSHHIIISCAVDLHLPRYEVFLAPLAAPPHDHVVDSLLTRSDSLAHRLSRARDQSLTTRQRPCEARSSTYTAVLSVTHTTRQVTRPVLCMQKQQTTQLNSSRALGTRFMFSGDNTRKSSVSTFADSLLVHKPKRPQRGIVGLQGVKSFHGCFHRSVSR